MSCRPTRLAPQRGIALFVVLALVLLAGLLAAAAARTALFEEMRVGHEADQQRSFARAQAALDEAELDIRDQGRERRPAGPGFPVGIETFDALQAALREREPSCDAGICVPDRIVSLFWTDPATFGAMKQVAAPPQAAIRPPGNARADPAPDADSLQAWYWVEVLPADIRAALDGGFAEAFSPDADRPFIYRITAIAQGLKPATRVVLQSTLVIKKRRS